MFTEIKLKKVVVRCPRYFSWCCEKSNFALESKNAGTMQFGKYWADIMGVTRGPDPPSWEHELSTSKYHCKHNCRLLNKIICFESICANYRCKSMQKIASPPHKPYTGPLHCLPFAKPHTQWPLNTQVQPSSYPPISYPVYIVQCFL